MDKVSNINDLISNSIIMIILIVMGINTIRSILAFSGWLRGTKYEKYIHDRNIDKVANLSAQQALANIGIGESERNFFRIISPAIIKSQLCFEKGDLLQSLFIIMAEHIKNFNHEIVYGKTNPTASRFYVNTMEASLNYHYCRRMSELLYQLYIQNYKSHPRIDFVVVPKIGNPILAIEFAKKCNAICIIRKGNNDNSRISSDTEDVYKILNFEGLENLQKIAIQSNQNLNGVIVDCNCSGGSSLISSAEEFNSLITKNLVEKINLIKNVYILFRADNDLSTQNINKKFSDTDLTLHRYIDLDEELKSRLASLKTQLEHYNHDIYRKEIIHLINEIKNHAINNSLTT